MALNFLRKVGSKWGGYQESLCGNARKNWGYQVIHPDHLPQDSIRRFRGWGLLGQLRFVEVGTVVNSASLKPERSSAAP